MLRRAGAALARAARAPQPARALAADAKGDAAALSSVLGVPEKELKRKVSCGRTSLPRGVRRGRGGENLA